MSTGRVAGTSFVDKGPSPDGALVKWVPEGWTGPALFCVKAVHSLIFLFLSGCTLHVLVAGLTSRVSRLTPYAIVAVLLEAAVLRANRGTCPLTSLAQRLGAERGSVSDMVLPDWFTPHIPVVFGSIFVTGCVGLARTLRRSYANR